MSTSIKETPLRKVVEVFTGDDGLQWERYECGHEDRQPHNIYRYVPAKRRRCWRCREAAKVVIYDDDLCQCDECDGGSVKDVDCICTEMQCGECGCCTYHCTCEESGRF